MDAMKIIDLHSHILPQLDDGSQSLEQSLEMADLAVRSGVRSMVVTPHCIQGDAREVMASFRLVQEALEDTGIPLRLFPGMEIMGTPETAALLKAGQLLTINGSRYPLIEFPFQASARENAQILESVLRAGFRPLIAHPERYECVQEDLDSIGSWVQMGCLLQVNRGSLLGRFGSGAQEAAFFLVETGLATVVASDAHSPRMRTPWMGDVYELLATEFSPTAARYLLWHNPGCILKNEPLPLAGPTGQSKEAKRR